MPAMFGGEEKQRKLMGRLEKEFEKCQMEYQLPRGDLPNVDRYRQMLACVASPCNHALALTSPWDGPQELRFEQVPKAGAQKRGHH